MIIFKRSYNSADHKDQLKA